jgi:hypothetical protein
LCDCLNHQVHVVSDVQVPLDMGSELRLAASQGADNTQRQQFARLDIQAASGVNIAKAESRQVLLNMLLVFRRIQSPLTDRITKNQCL